MKLPRKINPDPLLSSVVEIRLNFNLDREKVLNSIYKLFSTKYTNLKYIGLPPELKTQAMIRHKSDYQMSDEKFSLSFSEDVILFENLGEYPLWKTYFSNIKEDLKKISSSVDITSINRVGVRYISIFPNAKSITDVCRVQLELKSPAGYNQEKRVVHSILNKEDRSLILRIHEDTTAKKQNKPYSGLLIDIDASQTLNLSQEINESLYKVIDYLHSEEKELFFSILDEEFIKSLNPEY